MWRDKREDRVSRITYKEEIWKDIYEHSDLIRQNKNAYKLQGLEIMSKLNKICGKEVLSSIVNDEDALRQEATNDSPTEENACELEDSTPTTKAAKIQCPSIKDRYHLCGVDVSLSFYAFQMVSFNNQDSLNMEEHVQHVLALSSILLVQDNRWHPDVQGIFGRENLLNIHKALQEQFTVGIHTPVFNEKISNTVLNIVKNLKRERSSRIDAQIELLLLARNSSTIESKIIRSVAAMIEKLPKQAIKDEIKETELCHRYVDAFLSPLFDSPDEGVLFRWSVLMTSITNQEAAPLNSGSITKRRPDSCISELEGLYFDASLGFVEVKPSSEDDNKHALSKDLVRLGMFSKNAIDRWGMRGCLSIQVVGHKATFFLTTQPSADLYTMMELCIIHIPSCLADMSAYIMQFDEIAAFLQCYSSWCVHLPSDKACQPKGPKRITLSDEMFDSIAAHPKSNKRRCYTMH
ncbi:hypothetical protein G6F43_009120 [Rhizopus delemar]|nr:hypothetical protein G6F43_009120 [Rhizopus delemar]